MNNNGYSHHEAIDPDVEKYYGTERTEEVRDIIERMPTSFGNRITLIVAFIFSLILFFGVIVRYPDVVKGQVTVNSPVAPVKLVVSTPGKIKLTQFVSQSPVNSGDVVAYIQSATSYDTLQMIKKTLNTYDPTDSYNTSILSALPSKVALGELTSRYYIFLSNLHQMANFYNDSLYEKQILSLQNLYHHQVHEVQNSAERININRKTLNYAERFLKRDSILFEGKVVAEAELDKAKVDYLSSKAGYANARSSQIEAEKQAQQTISKITEIDVQKSEKKKELEIALLASYNDLVDNIILWEQKYLFKAPFKGHVQFLGFWTNDQFLPAQEPVFTIIPEAYEPYGQVVLPAHGAGKVKPGQEVIVKLDDFPYSEYGSVKGVVNSMSLTTNTEKTQQGNVEFYLVTVKFPEGLITNYGKHIAFRHGSKGSAEIITNDRRLIERLLGDFKYAFRK